MQDEGHKDKPVRLGIGPDSRMKQVLVADDGMNLLKGMLHELNVNGAVSGDVIVDRSSGFQAF
jgi:hypothetical protein